MFLINFICVFSLRKAKLIYKKMMHGLLLPERVLSFVQLAICLLHEIEEKYVKGIDDARHIVFLWKRNVT